MSRPRRGLVRRRGGLWSRWMGSVVGDSRSGEGRAGKLGKSHWQHGSGPEEEAMAVAAAAVVDMGQAGRMSYVARRGAFVGRRHGDRGEQAAGLLFGLLVAEQELKPERREFGIGKTSSLTTTKPVAAAVVRVESESKSVNATARGCGAGHPDIGHGYRHNDGAAGPDPLKSIGWCLRDQRVHDHK